ncbi:Siroheme synthase [Lysinibacillus sphaericus]
MDSMSLFFYRMKGVQRHGESVHSRSGGDVDLITVRGLRCIEQADVILYDRLVNKDLLAYAKKGASYLR